MSRSALQIAQSGLDDLWDIQCAFSNIHALFTVMLDHLPKDHTAHAFAKLGIAETNDWSLKAYQWAECMEDELGQVNAGGMQ